MKRHLPKFLFRSPRILAILFILFLTMFSLDVFGGTESIWMQIVGFIIHSIPSIILTIMLIISWKYELVGAITFTLAGLAYIALLIPSIINNPQTMSRWMLLGRGMPIAGPAILTGMLFRFNRKKRNHK